MAGVCHAHTDTCTPTTSDRLTKKEISLTHSPKDTDVDKKPAALSTDLVFLFCLKLKYLEFLCHPNLRVSRFLIL